VFSISGNVINLFIAFISYTAMVCAFLSGWFFMIKQAIKNPDKEEPNSLILDFPAGVGEYFLPTLGIISIVYLIMIIVLILTYMIGMKFIGQIGITQEALTTAMSTSEALKTFLASLSTEQMYKLNAWNTLLFFTMCTIYFLLMFYPPALFFTDKNPIKALYWSFKKLFSKRFFIYLLIFILLLTLYLILSVALALAQSNMFLYFLLELILLYYIVFLAILIFNIYEN
jgi:hypothetical protein